MNIQNNYNAWADTYDSDRNLTRDLDAKEIRINLGNFRSEKTLELGCGTGKNTQFLSEISKLVTAADYSEGMLSRAKKKSRVENVEFLQLDITKPWPFPDNTFHLVTSDLVLEHVEELDFIFTEASRVLLPGGVFYISELHPFRQYQGKKAEFFSGSEKIEIHSFIHNLTDFTYAAGREKFFMSMLHESWHQEDKGKAPRLIIFRFTKK